MENDLIHRNTGLAILRALKEAVANYAPVDDVDDAIDMVKTVNAIDAVEVVRCKDCEEYVPWLEGDYVCGRIGACFGNTKPNDFCSRGVRRRILR